MIWFFVSIAFSLIAWVIVTARYIWPELRLRPRVGAADALLQLESARLYGLIKGGPEVNADRCAEILQLGAARGFTPNPDAAERLIPNQANPLSQAA
jgi:hypothetical protein